MDPRRFDRLAKSLSASGTRRDVIRLLTALPLGVTLAPLLAGAPDTIAKDDVHGSSHQRHRRKAKHRHQPGNDKEHRKGQRKGNRKDKGKKTCTPEPVAQTCAGKCAIVTNTCGAQVDCGPCTCATGCPTCQSCNPTSGLCVNVANGTACNDGDVCTETETCQNGVCQGTRVTCTAPAICCPFGTPGACRRPARASCSSNDVCCSNLCGGIGGCCPVCPPDCGCGLLATGDVACFDLTHPDDPRCGAGGSCPPGQACSSGNRCMGICESLT